MVRSSVIEELSSDYVRTARAKGLSESQVLFRHAFRNALIPILTILGLQFGTLLAGAIVTETIFSWPGIGRLAVQAIAARDYPLLQGCILLIAVSYVVVNLLTDMVYALVDPRVRLRMKGLREFLLRSGPGRWGLGLALLLVFIALAAPWIAPARSDRAESSRAPARPERRALDGHRRSRPRHSLAHLLRRARVDAGCGQRGGRCGSSRPCDRRARGLLSADGSITS